MKFTIDKNMLLKNLQLLSKTIPSRSTLPIISSALLTVQNKTLSMRATDLEISINLTYKIEGGENGCIAIPLGKLLEITSALPEKNIDFRVSDIGKMNIYCNSGRYTIMGQPSEEFPSEQVVENRKSLKVSSKELKNIINNTSYAASKDDLKPVLQGVLFQIRNDGVISVATDGHRLVKLEKKNIHSIDYTGNIVVPIKFLNLLTTQLTSDDDVSLLIGDNHIQAQLEDVTITTRIIKDPYPDYEGVIPKNNTKTLIINKNNFTEAIKRVSIFSNKSSRQVALELSENSMTITTEDPENITTGKEVLDCDYDGEPMTIGYNAFYLKEVLQHQQSEEIKIMLNSPLNAGLFLSVDQNDNDNKTTLLMPIRLND